MPRHRGIWGQQWAKCGRCAFSWPVGQLMQQKGLLVCPRCIDNLDVEERPKIIAEVLSDTEESTTELENTYNDPQDVIF